MDKIIYTLTMNMPYGNAGEQFDERGVNLLSGTWLRFTPIEYPEHFSVTLPTKTTTTKKLLQLERSIMYLSNYIAPRDEIHVVLSEDGETDLEATAALKELSELNIKKREIISILTGTSFRKVNAKSK